MLWPTSLMDFEVFPIELSTLYWSAYIFIVVLLNWSTNSTMSSKVFLFSFFFPKIIFKVFNMLIMQYPIMVWIWNATTKVSYNPFFSLKVSNFYFRLYVTNIILKRVKWHSYIASLASLQLERVVVEIVVSTLKMPMKLFNVLGKLFVAWRSHIFIQNLSHELTT